MTFTENCKRKKKKKKDIIHGLNKWTVASGVSVDSIPRNSFIPRSSSFTSACNKIIKTDILCEMINMFDKQSHNEKDNAASNCW